MPNRMVFQIALLLVTLSANFFCINAHGLLLYPNSRNWLARLDKVDFCPHCLNEVDVCGGWGPFIYNNPIEDYSIVGEYSPGEIMDVEIHINAHHKGHFEFFLCDPADTEGGVSSPATQECLDRHPLTVVNDENSLYVIDDNHSNRLYLPPTCALEMVSPVQDITGYLLRGQVILPSNVECSHCVLQWHYITGNSCNSEGYHDAIFPEDDCASWWNPQLPDCGTPEEFWNCADISVTGEAASGASRSSESPTSTPNQQSTAQPTNAASPTTSPTDQPTSTPNLRTAQPTSQSNGQPTAVPTPNDGNTNDSSGQCVAEWNQCGGRGFTGSSDCCEGLECVNDNEWWSYCARVYDPSVQCRQHWQQCGGIGFTGLTTCCGGLECVKENEYWSSCQ